MDILYYGAHQKLIMAETATKKPTKKAVKTVAKKAPAKKETAKKSDNFSVIETGGKQYIVSVGDVIEVELLGEHKEGDKVTFDNVLLSDDGSSATVGTPTIKGAKVEATFLGEVKGKKVTILRYKAKSNRHRKQGHRQQYAKVEITKI